MIAYTKHSNTRQSDMQERVMHVVEQTIADKKLSVEIYARCPLDAIDIAHTIPMHEWKHQTKDAL
jgi:hypothetical protein